MTSSSTSFSQKDFLRRCVQDHFPKVAFKDDNDDELQLKRVEHACTVTPSMLSRAFPERQTRGRESFGSHGERYKMCFYANDKRKHLYCGVYFSSRAEGPPGNAHGGAIATVIDTALAAFAAHFGDRTCVTKNLHIIYEKPIPLESEVVIRCWFYQTTDKRLMAECDIISPATLTRHNRGKATLVVFPKTSAEELLAETTTTEIEARLIKLRLEEEAREDANKFTAESPCKTLVLPVIEFPNVPFLSKYEKSNEWEELDFQREFPDVVSSTTRGFIGVHRGKHFDFAPEGGTMLIKIFRHFATKQIEGLISFSRFTEGPPATVHGGAIAAALDSMFGDSVFFQAGWGHMTRMLSLEYKSPIPPGKVVCVKHLEISNNNQRKGVYIRGALVDAESDKVYCLGLGDFAPATKSPVPFEIMRDQFGRTSGKSAQENLHTFRQFSMGRGKI